MPPVDGRSRARLRTRGGSPRRLGRAHRRPSVVVTHAGTTNGRCVSRPFARLSQEEEERPTSVTRPHNRPWGALTPHAGQISHRVRSACLRVEEVRK
jgi:hypothetical protein